MKKTISALIFRLLGLAISVTGIVLHLISCKLPEAAFMGKHVLAYFTIQTNFFTAGIFLYLVLKTIVLSIKNKGLVMASMNKNVHLACTFYITITMLVYWLVLCPTGGLPKIPMLIASNLFLHTITPLMAIFECLFFFEHGSLKVKDSLKWLVYPIIYLISVYIIGAVSDEPYYKLMGKWLMYPYPFLDPQFVGVGGVVGCVIGLTVFFILFGALYIFLDNKLKARLDKKKAGKECAEDENSPA